MNFLKSRKILIGAILFIITIIAIVFFDKTLAIGIILISFLTLITFFALFKLGLKNKTLFLLLLITLIIHIGASLFIYYADFQPFSGGIGDYKVYHETAVEISQRLRQGNFSLEGLGISHYYPVVIGYIYTLTLPEMLIGQLFGVWLAVLGVLFTYLIVIELGSSKKWAFLIGLLTAIYPSYLFYGSLLLKDTIIIPLVLFGMLLFIKMMENFTGLKFLSFFIILTALIHLRFYVGYAVLFSFIVCWFIISSFKIKKRIIYGVFIVFLLGFSPQLLDYGYYGTKTLKNYINEETITSYREVVYAPDPVQSQKSTVVVPAPPIAVITPPVPSVPIVVIPPPALNPEPSSEQIIGTEIWFNTFSKSFDPFLKSLSFDNFQKILFPQNKKEIIVFFNVHEKPLETFSPEKKQSLIHSGFESSFVVAAGFDNPIKFIKNYLGSFICSLLGPFPWQIRYQRQLFALIETIPWYFLFSIFISGIVVSIKREGILKTLKTYRLATPLLLFSIISLAALSLFINNFGIITRIRIPSFIILLCLIPLGLNGFNLNNKYLNNIEKYSTKLYKKIINYRLLNLFY